MVSQNIIENDETLKEIMGGDNSTPVVTPPDSWVAGFYRQWNAINGSTIPIATLGGEAEHKKFFAWYNLRNRSKPALNNRIAATLWARETYAEYKGGYVRQLPSSTGIVFTPPPNVVMLNRDNVGQAVAITRWTPTFYDEWAKVINAEMPSGENYQKFLTWYQARNQVEPALNNQAAADKWAMETYTQYVGGKVPQLANFAFTAPPGGPDQASVVMAADPPAYLSFCGRLREGKTNLTCPQARFLGRSELPRLISDIDTKSSEGSAVEIFGSFSSENRKKLLSWLRDWNAKYQEIDPLPATGEYDMPEGGPLADTSCDPKVTQWGRDFCASFESNWCDKINMKAVPAPNDPPGTPPEGGWTWSNYGRGYRSGRYGYYNYSRRYYDDDYDRRGYYGRDFDRDDYRDYGYFDRNSREFERNSRDFGRDQYHGGGRRGYGGYRGYGRRGYGGGRYDDNSGGYYGRGYYGGNSGGYYRDDAGNEGDADAADNADAVDETPSPDAMRLIKQWPQFKSKAQAAKDAHPYMAKWIQHRDTAWNGGKCNQHDWAFDTYNQYQQRPLGKWRFGRVKAQRAARGARKAMGVRPGRRMVYAPMDVKCPVVGMQTPITGPPQWRLMHSLPHVTEGKCEPVKAQKYLRRLGRIMPCLTCRHNYTNFVRNNPLEDISSTDDWHDWMISAHNDVNSRSQKPLWSAEKAKDHYWKYADNNWEQDLMQSMYFQLAFMPNRDHYNQVGKYIGSMYEVLPSCPMKTRLGDFHKAFAGRRKEEPSSSSMSWRHVIGEPTSPEEKAAMPTDKTTPPPMTGEQAIAMAHQYLEMPRKDARSLEERMATVRKAYGYDNKSCKHV